MKVFPLKYLVGFILVNAYTKSDIKSLQKYYDSFLGYEAVDYARNQYQTELTVLINKISNCTTEHQIRTLIKNQPLEIKYFIFERLQLISNFATDANIESLQIEDDCSIGQALVDILEETWQSVQKAVSSDAGSPAKLADKIMLAHLKNP